MEQFLKEFQELPMPDKGVDFNVGYFDQYQFDTFMDTLEKRPDADVIRFFRSNLSYIATRVLSGKWAHARALGTDKFMRCYTQAVATTPINGTIRIATNEIIRFLAPKVGSKDPRYYRPELEDQCIALGAIINTPYVEQLITSCDFTQRIATILCINRFSNLDEGVCVTRLNYAIECYGPRYMDEQTIIFIYEKLFDRVGSLFKWTMLEHYTNEEWNNNPALHPNFAETYGAISLAILDIINNMPMEAIRQVIEGFVDDWYRMDRPPTRFSLRALSSDYWRINTIVDGIVQNNIYVP